MRLAQVQFTPWHKASYFDPGELILVVGEQVIVKTELGQELGRVVAIRDIALEKIAELPDVEKNEKGELQISPVLCKATKEDKANLTSESVRQEALVFCRKMIEKYQLPMKLVDVVFSFDSSRVTFAFISDGRVDFRELAKELTRHFNKMIRLQQIGIRDEARLMGDYGHCGRPLCCGSFLSELSSITSDMSELQQVAHRGSERTSGVCGRLMCCLAYEQSGYQEMTKRMPPLGAKVNVDGKKGIVVGHHLLKESVDVEFLGENGEDRTVIEVDLNRNNKK
jgi:cell fate regulator YaaT (PSP1 superfamily)